MANSYTDVSCVCVFELLNQIGVLKGAFFSSGQGIRWKSYTLFFSFFFFYLFIMQLLIAGVSCYHQFLMFLHSMDQSLLCPLQSQSAIRVVKHTTSSGVKYIIMFILMGSQVWRLMTGHYKGQRRRESEVYSELQQRQCFPF